MLHLLHCRFWNVTTYRAIPSTPTSTAKTSHQLLIKIYHVFKYQTWRSILFEKVAYLLFIMSPLFWRRETYCFCQFSSYSYSFPSTIFCPGHNSKTIRAFNLKLYMWIDFIEEKCSAQESLLCTSYFWSYCPLFFLYFILVGAITLKL